MSFNCVYGCEHVCGDGSGRGGKEEETSMKCRS